MSLEVSRRTDVSASNEKMRKEELTEKENYLYSIVIYKEIQNRQTKENLEDVFFSYKQIFSEYVTHLLKA